jgi:hypothetical protein
MTPYECCVFQSQFPDVALDHNPSTPSCNLDGFQMWKLKGLVVGHIKTFCTQIDGIIYTICTLLLKGNFNLLISRLRKF